MICVKSTTPINNNNTPPPPQIIATASKARTAGQRKCTVAERAVGEGQKFAPWRGRVFCGCVNNQVCQQDSFNSFDIVIDHFRSCFCKV